MPAVRGEGGIPDATLTAGGQTLTAQLTGVVRAASGSRQGPLVRALPGVSWSHGRGRRRVRRGGRQRLPREPGGTAPGRRGGAAPAGRADGGDGLGGHRRRRRRPAGGRRPRPGRTGGAASPAADCSPPWTTPSTAISLWTRLCGRSSHSAGRGPRWSRPPAPRRACSWFRRRAAPRPRAVRRGPLLRARQVPRPGRTAGAGGAGCGTRPRRRPAVRCPPASARLRHPMSPASSRSRARWMLRRVASLTWLPS